MWKHNWMKYGLLSLAIVAGLAVAHHGSPPASREVARPCEML